MKKVIKCSVCDGQGMVYCYFCGGAGKVIICDEKGALEVECAECNGEGGWICGNCKGSGVIEIDIQEKK